MGDPEKRCEGRVEEKDNLEIVSDWKKQASLIQKSNPTAYQKYQQMIQKLEIGSRIN